MTLARRVRQTPCFPCKCFPVWWPGFNLDHPRRTLGDSLRVFDTGHAENINQKEGATIHRAVNNTSTSCWWQTDQQISPIDESLRICPEVTSMRGLLDVAAKNPQKEKFITV
jgi:hypothetical protein